MYLAARRHIGQVQTINRLPSSNGLNHFILDELQKYATKVDLTKHYCDFSIFGFNPYEGIPRTALPGPGSLKSGQKF